VEKFIDPNDPDKVCLYHGHWAERMATILDPDAALEGVLGKNCDFGKSMIYFSLSLESAINHVPGSFPGIGSRAWRQVRSIAQGFHYIYCRRVSKDALLREPHISFGGLDPQSSSCAPFRLRLDRGEAARSLVAANEDSANHLWQELCFASCLKGWLKKRVGGNHVLNAVKALPKTFADLSDVNPRSLLKFASARASWVSGPVMRGIPPICTEEDFRAAANNAGVTLPDTAIRDDDMIITALTRISANLIQPNTTTHNRQIAFSTHDDAYALVMPDLADGEHVILMVDDTRQARIGWRTTAMVADPQEISTYVANHT
jgi:hypothetical protein